MWILQYTEGNFFIGFLTGAISFAGILFATGYYSDAIKPWREKRALERARNPKPAPPLRSTPGVPMKGGQAVLPNAPRPRPQQRIPEPPPRARHSGQVTPPFGPQDHPANDDVQVLPVVAPPTSELRAQPPPPGVNRESAPIAPEPLPPVEAPQEEPPAFERRSHRDPEGRRRRRRDNLRE